VVAGATPDLLADAAPVPIAWVGRRLADELHVRPADGAPGTEAQVVVAGHPLSVAGIIANSAGFTYVESSIVVSRPVALRALGGQGTNVRLIAHVRPGSARAVAQYAVRTLDPAGGLALVDQTPADGERLLGSVGGDLRRVGTALGLIVGLVGMVAVSNTLMMAVHHRLRELGLRSAIGWSRRRIALLVLTEAGIAGAAAGVIGASAGLGAAAAWCWRQEWTLVFPSLLPVVVTAAAIGASVVGGVIPALRAASISPFTAMRS
jgi:putative ABC transport system permease protein